MDWSGGTRGRPRCSRENAKSREPACQAKVNGLGVGIRSEVVNEQNKIEYADRNIAADEAALNDLEKLGYMTTPGTVIDGEVVVGFDLPKLRNLLEL